MSDDRIDDLEEDFSAVHFLREDAMRVSRQHSDKEIKEEDIEILRRYVAALYRRRNIRRVELVTGSRIDEFFGHPVRGYGYGPIY